MISRWPLLDGALAVLEGGDHGEADEAGAGGAEAGTGDGQDGALGETSGVRIAGFALRHADPEIEGALAAHLQAALAQVGEKQRALLREDAAALLDVRVVV